MNIKNLINIIINKPRFMFGYKPDKSPIPKGHYCYAPDTEKNNKNKCLGSVYYIKPCEYYKVISKNYNACSYLNTITNCIIFDDQCKMCGENYN